jgi:hypothetical protein
MKELIRMYGRTTSGQVFKRGVDAYLDYDEDGIINAFDCQPLNFFKQDTKQFYDHKDFSSLLNFNTHPKYSVTTKYMTGDEFLALAKKTSYSMMDKDKSTEQYSSEVLDKDKVKEYADALRKGDKFPTPFLGYQSGESSPYRHEGRHRAAAFKAVFGKKKLPVYLVRNVK